ncbi:hypothetical protein Btru_036633 [Bulinus truncatus]|nr:hypothetical protein Btru_036633 [Bulinus truncatus]
MSSLILVVLLGLFLDIISAKPNTYESEVLKVLTEPQKFGSKLNINSILPTFHEKIENMKQDSVLGYKEVVDEWTHDVKKISHDYIKVVSGLSFHGKNCWCSNYTCGCCYNIVVEKISLNDTGCLNITYLVDEYGFEFTFTLNGKVIIDRKISVKNPPPICAAIPYVHNLASLCLRFYNLDFVNKQFTGCADLEAELEGVVVKSLELGCFKIPPDSKNLP